MAAELKDARNKLASQELLFAQESETRKVAELKARNLEEEVWKLQKCLEDKDELLRLSLCSTEQYHNELDGLRSQLSVTQATAEATAVSAMRVLLHCSSLLGKLNDKDNSLSERELPGNNLAEQVNHLHGYPEGRDYSRMQLKGYSLRTESDITDAFAKSGFDNDNELLKIMSDVSPNSENIDKDLILEDDGIAKLRVGIMVLSAHWTNKSKELESQLDKHRRTVQELKRKVLKLEFGLQEPRSRLWKLQRIRKKRDKSLKLRNQVAVEQPSGGGSGDKHNLWESSVFKLIASMSMLALFTLAKR
ncbi:nuclear envelope-associated protein 2-like isoform X2 [Phragmites australis]|nr:nuclear envelope-associated protein 2-like isoform X2 [Phragmites australis]